MILSLVISLIVKAIDEIKYRRSRKVAPVIVPEVDPGYGYHIPERVMRKGWTGKYNDVY